MLSKELPIGYWIKQADELLTKGINVIHSSFDLDRTEWQVLHSINEKGQINKIELTAFIKPFADQDTLNTIIKKFEEAEVLQEKGETLTLTGKGIELHRTCFERQKVFRQKAMAGVSESQYQETVSTLRKIVENLNG